MSDVFVQPVRGFSRTIECPPDKSITHRAILFNAAANGKSEVKRILTGEDCLSTIDCMRALGATVEIVGNTARITGTQRFRSAPLYAGNSGTTMRLLCGLLAAKQGEWTLSGDESLSARPMRRVTHPLEQMGGMVLSRNGHAPLTVRGTQLHGIRYEMPVASAQVKSAVLLAALGAHGTTKVVECEPTRNHTEILLEQMGVRISREQNALSLQGGQSLSPVCVTVAGDISSAAFPLVCGLITGGVVTVKNVGLNPTRMGLLEVFDSVGVTYEVSDVRTSGGEKTGTVTVKNSGHGRGFSIGKQIMPRLIDEIPVLAVLACFLGSESVITDAHELKVKESNRIAATVRLIRAFGGIAEETESGMVISPSGGLQGGCTFHPAGDHRMAMAAAVAAAASKQGGRVCGAECVRVSYPDFWQMLAGERT